jgi:SAM-dependent methyltransferase
MCAHIHVKAAALRAYAGQPRYQGGVPASFMRRRDLFLDAGFTDPDGALAALAQEVAALALPAEWGARTPEGGVAALAAALAPRVSRVPVDQRRLARLVPEWLGERAGDLATALWLARAEHGDALDLPGYLLAILDALASSREEDALAYARFMLDLRFDWARVWRDPSIAWEFLKEREPNPLVWRLLEELAARGERVRVLELGCGVGNDAFGFLRAGLVDGYVGVDLSAEALAAFRRRVERERPRVEPTLVQGDFLDVLGRSDGPAAGSTLVYSYSSLHYFSSAELARIYALVRSLLAAAAPGGGFFAFGIKGKGSVWDGQGLPVYRPDVWVNWDGQSRWFPSPEALVRQLDRAGFEVRFHELHEHWGYSELGRKDVFHYVLLSPRKD